jgi:hypothetical protein
MLPQHSEHNVSKCAHNLVRSFERRQQITNICIDFLRVAPQVMKRKPTDIDTMDSIEARGKNARMLQQSNQSLIELTAHADLDVSDQRLAELTMAIPQQSVSATMNVCDQSVVTEMYDDPFQIKQVRGQRGIQWVGGKSMVHDVGCNAKRYIIPTLHKISAGILLNQIMVPKPQGIPIHVIQEEDVTWGMKRHSFDCQVCTWSDYHIEPGNYHVNVEMLRAVQKAWRLPRQALQPLMHPHLAVDWWLNAQYMDTKYCEFVRTLAWTDALGKSLLYFPKQDEQQDNGNRTTKIITSSTKFGVAIQDTNITTIIGYASPEMFFRQPHTSRGIIRLERDGSARVCAYDLFEGATNRHSHTTFLIIWEHTHCFVNYFCFNATADALLQQTAANGFADVIMACKIGILHQSTPLIQPTLTTEAAQAVEEMDEADSLSAPLLEPTPMVTIPHWYDKTIKMMRQIVDNNTGMPEFDQLTLLSFAIKSDPHFAIMLAAAQEWEGLPRSTNSQPCFMIWVEIQRLLRWYGIQSNTQWWWPWSEWSEVVETAIHNLQDQNPEEWDIILDENIDVSNLEYAEASCATQCPHHATIVQGDIPEDIMEETLEIWQFMQKKSRILLQMRHIILMIRRTWDETPTDKQSRQGVMMRPGWMTARDHQEAAFAQKFKTPHKDSSQQLYAFTSWMGQGIRKVETYYMAFWLEQWHTLSPPPSPTRHLLLLDAEGYILSRDETTKFTFLPSSPATWTIWEVDPEERMAPQATRPIPNAAMTIYKDWGRATMKERGTLQRRRHAKYILQEEIKAIIHVYQTTIFIPLMDRRNQICRILQIHGEWTASEEAIHEEPPPYSVAELYSAVWRLCPPNVRTSEMVILYADGTPLARDDNTLFSKLYGNWQPGISPRLMAAWNTYSEVDRELTTINMSQYPFEYLDRDPTEENYGSRATLEIKFSQSDDRMEQSPRFDSDAMEDDDAPSSSACTSTTDDLEEQEDWWTCTTFLLRRDMLESLAHTNDRHAPRLRNYRNYNKMAELPWIVVQNTFQSDWRNGGEIHYQCPVVGCPRQVHITYGKMNTTMASSSVKGKVNYALQKHHYHQLEEVGEPILGTCDVLRIRKECDNTNRWMTAMKRWTNAYHQTRQDQSRTIIQSAQHGLRLMTEAIETAQEVMMRTMIGDHHVMALITEQAKAAHGAAIRWTSSGETKTFYASANDAHQEHDLPSLAYSVWVPRWESGDHRILVVASKPTAKYTYADVYADIRSNLGITGIENNFALRWQKDLIYETEAICTLPLHEGFLQVYWRLRGGKPSQFNAITIETQSAIPYERRYSPMKEIVTIDTIVTKRPPGSVTSTGRPIPLQDAHTGATLLRWKTHPDSKKQKPRSHSERLTLIDSKTRYEHPDSRTHELAVDMFSWESAVTSQIVNKVHAFYSPVCALYRQENLQLILQMTARLEKMQPSSLPPKNDHHQKLKWSHTKNRRGSTDAWAVRARTPAPGTAQSMIHSPQTLRIANWALPLFNPSVATIAPRAVTHIYGPKSDEAVRVATEAVDLSLISPYNKVTSKRVSGTSPNDAPGRKPRNPLATITPRRRTWPAKNLKMAPRRKSPERGVQKQFRQCRDTIPGAKHPSTAPDSPIRSMQKREIPHRPSEAIIQHIVPVRERRPNVERPNIADGSHQTRDTSSESFHSNQTLARQDSDQLYDKMTGSETPKHRPDPLSPGKGKHLNQNPHKQPRAPSTEQTMTPAAGSDPRTTLIRLHMFQIHMPTGYRQVQSSASTNPYTLSALYSDVREALGLEGHLGARFSLMWQCRLLQENDTLCDLPLQEGRLKLHWQLLGGMQRAPVESPVHLRSTGAAQREILNSSIQQTMHTLERLANTIAPVTELADADMPSRPDEKHLERAHKKRAIGETGDIGEEEDLDAGDVIQPQEAAVRLTGEWARLLKKPLARWTPYQEPTDLPPLSDEQLKALAECICTLYEIDGAAMQYEPMVEGPSPLPNKKAIQCVARILASRWLCITPGTIKTLESLSVCPMRFEIAMAMIRAGWRRQTQRPHTPDRRPAPVPFLILHARVASWPLHPAQDGAATKSVTKWTEYKQKCAAAAAALIHEKIGHTQTTMEDRSQLDPEQGHFKVFLPTPDYRPKTMIPSHGEALTLMNATTTLRITPELRQILDDQEGYVGDLHLVPFHYMVPVDIPTQRLMGLVAAQPEMPKDILGASKLLCSLLNDAVQQTGLSNAFLYSLKEESQDSSSEGQLLTRPVPDKKEMLLNPFLAFMTKDLSKTLNEAHAGLLSGLFAGVLPFTITLTYPPRISINKALTTIELEEKPLFSRRPTDIRALCLPIDRHWDTDGNEVGRWYPKAGEGKELDKKQILTTRSDQVAGQWIQTLVLIERKGPPLALLAIMAPDISAQQALEGLRGSSTAGMLHKWSGCAHPLYVNVAIEILTNASKPHLTEQIQRCTRDCDTMGVTTPWHHPPDYDYESSPPAATPAACVFEEDLIAAAQAAKSQSRAASMTRGRGRGRGGRGGRGSGHRQEPESQLVRASPQQMTQARAKDSDSHLLSMMQAFTKHTEDRLSQIESHIQTQSTTTDNLHKSVQSIQAKTELDKAELRAEAEAAKLKAAQENSAQMTTLMAQMERMHTLIAAGQQQVAQQINTAIQAALLPPALPMGQQAPAEGGTPSIPVREHLEAHPPDKPNV